MDLTRTIQALYAHKERIEKAIVALEAMLRTQTGRPPEGKRRGRKSMGPAERAEVAERMKTYWAKRRAEKTPSA